MEDQNELSPEVLSTSSLNPWDGSDSSARKNMANTHIGQAPWVVGAETRRFFTGTEFEFGKYTFDVKFPSSCRVIHIFDKYKRGIGEGSIKLNPMRYIVYEELTSEARLGIVALPHYRSLHKDFGFPMVMRKSAEEKLRSVGDRQYPPYFEEDEVIASSPALKENGEYAIGINANVVALALPSTIEDGFLVSRSFLERMRSTGIHKLSADFGKRCILLNLYGDDEHYKPFPDLGDRIRPDGMVFAMREIDDAESMMEMTPAALRRVDAAFDKPMFGEPNAVVIDITVWHDERGRKKSYPIKLDEQPRKYYEAGKAFHEDVLRVYKRYYMQRNKALHITPEFNQLVFEAQVYLPDHDGKAVTRSHRLDRLDEWRVDLTYQYDIKPTTGFKFTDIHGSLEPVYSVMDK